jgi:hypothetical protein
MLVPKTPFQTPKVTYDFKTLHVIWMCQVLTNQSTSYMVLINVTCFDLILAYSIWQVQNVCTF